MNDRMKVLAGGRILLGVASVLAPRRFAAAVGVSEPSSELAYMTQVYGARAVAMGAGYLTAAQHERGRWETFSLAIDLSDTVAGLVWGRRPEVSRRAALSLIAITAGYAAIGVTHVVRRGVAWH
ncbi:hypothetical protein VZC37_04350 [Gordonia sp. LSe1-13]|uniref:DUF4267 domain-containing protein n=1 Tax=Gordonia sesuvii TaxID=3116777 RepID=A0ABU7M9Q3_9ACTN|nr:hypothetical protein [Gordonia sp. LSe1-13]